MASRTTRVLAWALALSVPSAPALAAEPQTLRVALHSDLKIVDPIWTTALITVNHGYMIYDTLFALDDKLDVQPQMVDRYEISRRQADLDLHAARRARMARRPAGHGRGLHRLAQALGRARRHGPEAHVLRRRASRRRTPRPSA